MKIIIIGPAHPLRGGGMATFNERLARNKRGIKQVSTPFRSNTLLLSFPALLNYLPNLHRKIWILKFVLTLSIHLTGL
jgi:hypothetical protein